jgi:hypothetical protein
MDVFWRFRVLVVKKQDTRTPSVWVDTKKIKVD